MIDHDLFFSNMTRKGHAATPQAGPGVVRGVLRSLDACRTRRAFHDLETAYRSRLDASNQRQMCLHVKASFGSGKDRIFDSL